MKANGTLIFLTDFGSCDWYVASMKAAALTANKSVQILDITHEISPGSVSEGSFVLDRCYHDFPAGTTFVVVVDPGVGTYRSPLIIITDDYAFVGPDNGVLYPVVNKLCIQHCIRIESPEWMGKKTSNTFHGRDIFAPAGSHLAAGKSVTEAGPSVESIVQFEFPKPVRQDSRMTGRFLYFDRFGNGLTNLLSEHLDTQALAGLRIGETVFPLAKTFGEVEVGDPVCYWGSSGFLEVAIRDGNAKERFQFTENTTTEPVYEN
ncbi:MAG: hypothetical protein CMI18_14380 [Opitutaceae bacterium]|nr:hypothetical protein [Opitutaceae bacterium]